VIADVADDVLGLIGIPHNTRKRFHHFAQVRRAHFQEAHSRTSVVA
jgi:hypothetical protein